MCWPLPAWHGTWRHNCFICICGVMLHVILCVYGSWSGVSVLTAGPTAVYCDVTVECGDWQVGFRRFLFYYEYVGSVLPCYFIFNTSAFFSCEVKAWSQLDHVFVAVSLSFYACLRLYQLYGGKNAECTVLRASLNYSTSLPLNFWLTLVSNTLVIVPPMEKRFFPLSLYLFLLLLKTEGTHPVCLCAVFRVTLYFWKKSVDGGVQRVSIVN